MILKDVQEKHDHFLKTYESCDIHCYVKEKGRKEWLNSKCEKAWKRLKIKVMHKNTE